MHALDDELDDFFGVASYGPPRDRYGRPMLIPTRRYPGATAADIRKEKRVPYTRASTLSDYIANFVGLHMWQKRRLAYGLAQSENLCAMAAALPKFKNDRELDRKTNAELDQIIYLALELGQVHEQANWGTAVHGFTEPENDHGTIPARMVSDVDSFFTTLKRAGIRIHSTELFVANDELKTAGTFDHILEVPGHGKILADKKTGDLKKVESAIQLAAYVDGELYDWDTDQRTPLPDDLSRDRALIIHIPAGQGRTTLHWVDLNYGRRMARIAADVRDGHSEGRKIALSEDVSGDLIAAYQARHAELESEILGLPGREEIVALRTAHLDWWSAELDEVCSFRLEQLADSAA